MTRSATAERGGLGGERFAQRTVADEQETQAWIAGGQRGEFA